MDTITTILSTLPTIVYYTLLLLLSLSLFILASLFVFIHTPGDFIHPYYETEGSGFGNDHSLNRGYRPGRTFLPPVRRVLHGSPPVLLSERLFFLSFLPPRFSTIIHPAISFPSHLDQPPESQLSTAIAPESPNLTSNFQDPHPFSAAGKEEENGLLIWNTSVTVNVKELPYLNYEADHLVDPLYFFAWILRIIALFLLYQVLLIVTMALVIITVDFAKEVLEVKGYVPLLILLNCWTIGVNGVFG
ncbi:uncharacterized protein DFL_003083 [Arthrobotrys flagrans]|uniref:Uncharacterized protein n=1 Tax=Arthrobotrys flagrans TaxID=97331 RepID=A0A437ADP3_ARTFL|nr:hypothetical protein DFL_003083 [Arthrobotrys flagrans]